MVTKTRAGNPRLGTSKLKARWNRDTACLSALTTASTTPPMPHTRGGNGDSTTRLTIATARQPVNFIKDSDDSDMPTPNNNNDNSEATDDDNSEATNDDDLEATDNDSDASDSNLDATDDNMDATDDNSVATANA
ncbi:hypothetical protein EDB86DRAFT_2824922 [Lactarius hatsudake]|nr:hypothetical protein EDB86DRAFT_2824922 [Lactarius hatsudake]